MAEPGTSPQNPPMAYPGLSGARAVQQSGTDFFLSNYRLGKTLGIGSFGKARPARAWRAGARHAGGSHGPEAGARQPSASPCPSPSRRSKSPSMSSRGTRWPSRS